LAVTEKEQHAVTAFFEQAKEEKRLTNFVVSEIDVLYPYTNWPCVLRVATEKGVELWACELNRALEVIAAIQVGTQDNYGNNHWAMK